MTITATLVRACRTDPSATDSVVDHLLWRRSRASEEALAHLLADPPSEEARVRILRGAGDRRWLRPHVLAATRAPEGPVREAAYGALRGRGALDGEGWAAVKRGMVDPSPRVRALATLEAVDVLTARHDLRADPEIVALAVRCIREMEVGRGAVILRLCRAREALDDLLDVLTVSREPDASHLLQAVLAVCDDHDRPRVLRAAEAAGLGEIVEQVWPR